MGKRDPKTFEEWMEQQFDFANLLVWYAAEEYARRLSEEDEDDY